MRTLIAIPSMDQVPAQFAASLAMLEKPKGETVVGFQIGSLIYEARNQLARQAIKMEADYVFWLDSDMVFEPDILTRLIEDYKAGKGDIISGLYFRRVSPFTPVIFDTLDITDTRATWKAPKDVPEGITEVGGIGFGCVLMDVQVLMDVFAKFGNAFTPITGLGEDLSFCWRARQCGYKIVVDPAVSLGHVGHIIITKDMYEGMRANGGIAE